MLDEVSGAAATTRDLLSRTARDIIAVNDESRPTVALLARYSPEYPCFIRGIGAVVNRIKGAQPSTGPQRFGPKVTLEFLPPKHAYSYPDDLPAFADRRGPHCYGLPHPPDSLRPIHYKDGTGPDRGGAMARSRNHRAHEHHHQRTPAGDNPIDDLLGPLLGNPDRVPPIAGLLFGPLLRGTTVRVS
jgi:hypothetical protein